MIETLYPTFQHWSKTGSVYLISDTHFDDNDVCHMDPNWPAPESVIDMLRQKVHKNDTLIHFGDVGDPTYLEQAWPVHKRPHLVLIMGNHDETVEKFKDLFDEIYTGPIFVAEKLVFSHEPLPGIDWAFNIHGHAHNARKHPNDIYHLNIASNVIGWKLLNLKDLIKAGHLKPIKSLHRRTIDKATHHKRH